MAYKVSVEDYEIGNQKNFDFCDTYELLLDKTIEEGEDIKFEKHLKEYLKEYHHSLFYPILAYCVEVLNSYDLEKLEKNKLRIGIDKNRRIYVSVNRMIYDLFFTEKEGSIDGHTIDFNLGKDKFNLKSIHSKYEKTAKEDYKIYFDISPDEPNKSVKETLNKMSTDLNLTFKQLIQSKKKTIITRFLKGYSHQEGILKSFEAKTKGQFFYMPNLIFKEKNDDGRTIEEIDQIYLLNLKEKKITINEFEVFFYVDYSKIPHEYKIITEGMPLELETNNLYFIEVKKSSGRLNESYLDLKDNKLEKNSSKNSSRYQRKNLTELGNSILTTINFANLIREITNKQKIINLLYIVDDEYDLEMCQNFYGSLKRDEEVINTSGFVFKIKLIYTQPDLALKNFIEENNEKNKEIKSLNEILMFPKGTF